MAEASEQQAIVNFFTLMGHRNPIFSGGQLMRIGDLQIFWSANRITRIGQLPVIYSMNRLSRIGQWRVDWSGNRITQIVVGSVRV